MNNDDDKRIIITKVYGYKQTDSDGQGSVPPIKPINRWVIYLTLVPLAVVAIVLGAFFFAAFLALFAIIAVAFAIRIWWLRRKLRDKTHATEEGEYVIIEDAEIVETEKDVSSKRNT